MSKNYAEFEKSIADSINNFKNKNLPEKLPNWMLSEGINPGSTIISASDIGSKSSKNKTDIIVNLKDSEPLKISVKMLSADHMGNWYGHKRVVDEFGIDAFKKITESVTKWTNKFKTNKKWENKPFVGVSICFGNRPGKTGVPFTEVFPNPEQRNKIILDIARGAGKGENVANSFYSSDNVPADINDLINILEPINLDTIKEITNDFMLSMRPVAPKENITNRGKNVYSQFVLNDNEPRCTKIEITTMSQLNKIGTFKEVEFDGLTHNKIIDRLESKNIIVPKKTK